MSAELLDDNMLNDLQLVRASKTKRFINFFVDYIASIIIIVVVFVMYIKLTGSPNYFELEDDSAFFNVLFAVGYFLYFFVCELFLKGKTIGKYITRTRAIGEEGTLIDARQAAIRAISRFVPFETLSIFFVGDDIMWHDKWADTIVIDETASNWSVERLI